MVRCSEKSWDYCDSKGRGGMKWGRWHTMIGQDVNEFRAGRGGIESNEAGAKSLAETKELRTNNVWGGNGVDVMGAGELPAVSVSCSLRR